MLVAVEDGTRYEPDGTEVTYSVLIDDETGEVVYEGVPPGSYSLTQLFDLFRDAKEQEAAWKQRYVVLQLAVAQEMERQGLKRAEFGSHTGGLRVAVGRKTNWPAFNAELRDMETTKEDLLGIIGACSGLREKELPKFFADMYNRHSTFSNSQWIDVRAIRRRI